jgi:hypothetical protein
MDLLNQAFRAGNILNILPLLALGLLALGIVPSFAASNTIVKEGKLTAIIVIPDDPLAAVQFAAEELVYHLEKATGAKIPIVSESTIPAQAGYRIYLGETKAAQATGMDARKLAPETFALKTGENALFIVGNDTAGDPLDRDTSAGTLFGVYEWLETELGVRWVWPGELGTFVPKTTTVTVHTINKTVSPHFFQRNVRNGLGFTSEHPAMGFTPKAAEAYAREQTLFLRRCRMGRSQKMSYGHAFTDWWEKYGTEHPEWFQLVNGKRGPATPGARYSMCVSNPGLHQKIVDLWKANGGATTGDGPSYINVVENDILGFCECENCRAWDGPEPPDAMKYYAPNFKVYGSRFVSDRYARFEQAVLKLAAKENPKAIVIGYVYFNYFQAPTSNVKLHSNVLLGFCPSAGWYPRADDEHDWYKRQWKGWADTGARQFMRTNYFLDGYCMPFIFAHQFADDFHYAVKNGMVATDFDSLTGQWATQGPSLYLLMRLQTRPEAKADDLLAEYYSAFGPAAPEVKAYFDYWEKYTMDNRPLIYKSFEDRVAIRWRTWAKAAHKVFPETCFAPGEALLSKAAIAAAGDQESLARVRFLQTGLTHAKLCSRVAALLTLADPTATPERGKHELEELLTFRRAHEREGFANLNHESWVEDLSWKLSSETKQEPELYP